VTYGGVTQAYGYDPYGNALRVFAPGEPADFRYAGMFYNADSGLYLTRWRVYDPAIGRWLSRDPIGEAGDPAANLYRYVAGNPIGVSDPLGLCGNGPPNLPQLLGLILAIEIAGGGPEDPIADALALEEIAAYGGEGLDALVAEEEAAAEEAGLTGTALARSLGQAGEDAVGITGPKVSIEIPGSGQIRIPDALTDTTLTEVKNVGSLSYTQQLQDFTTYSQANGLDFQLYVRPSTQLSGPLQQAITNGQINLNFIPGAP
jgi:RHS repeat-associated protein